METSHPLLAKLDLYHCVDKFHIAAINCGANRIMFSLYYSNSIFVAIFIWPAKSLKAFTPNHYNL